MADIFQNFVCLTWLALAIIVFVGLKRWNRRFSDLYEEMKKQIEDGGDNG